MEIQTCKSEKLGEQYFWFQHESGLLVYVFPKEMASSYALFATKYGSLENKFKLTADDDFTTVPAVIAHFLEHKMFENEDGVDTFVEIGPGKTLSAFVRKISREAVVRNLETWEDLLQWT